MISTDSAKKQQCVTCERGVHEQHANCSTMGTYNNSGPSSETDTAAGISYSTARWLAPASFLIDFAAQQYGMFSSPNMKEIHDRHLSFWSPQPFFIAGFFFPQQLFQLGWLYRLWKLDPSNPGQRAELDEIVDFVPYYSVGNLCIAGQCSRGYCRRLC